MAAWVAPLGGLAGWRLLLLLAGLTLAKPIRLMLSSV